MHFVVDFRNIMQTQEDSVARKINVPESKNEHIKIKPSLLTARIGLSESTAGRRRQKVLRREENEAHVEGRGGVSECRSLGASWMYFKCKCYLHTFWRHIFARLHNFHILQLVFEYFRSFLWDVVMYALGTGVKSSLKSIWRLKNVFFLRRKQNKNEEIKKWNWVKWKILKHQGKKKNLDVTDPTMYIL